ncbi:putative vesicle membrane protein with acyltransferase activity [Phaeosphaeriaceae sp. SRC1lsM3a]|nr:putative vesicle membrane protein with acyltransferase activity [Stagonospora sp. SRC1lsM3a]
MKVLYIGVFKSDPTNSVQLASATELSHISRFTRNAYYEFMVFAGQRLANVTQPGQRHVLDEKEKGFVVYSLGHTAGACGIVITDSEYKPAPAHSLNSKITNDFVNKYPRPAFEEFARNWKKNDPLMSMPVFNDYIQKYQDPLQVDNVAKIQNELDETKAVLHKTIESVLQRGEKIDDLVAKSDGLSASSKMFYTQAKKQNSCCIVM